MLKTREGDTLGTSAPETFTSAPETFLRLPEVKKRVGVSTPTIYRWISLGVFPRPIRCGDNVSVWLASEITSWQRARIAERDGEAA